MTCLHHKSASFWGISKAGEHIHIWYEERKLKQTSVNWAEISRKGANCSFYGTEGALPLHALPSCKLFLHNWLLQDHWDWVKLPCPENKLLEIGTRAKSSWVRTNSPQFKGLHHIDATFLPLLTAMIFLGHPDHMPVASVMPNKAYVGFHFSLQMYKKSTFHIQGNTFSANLKPALPVFCWSKLNQRNNTTGWMVL